MKQVRWPEPRVDPKHEPDEPWARNHRGLIWWLRSLWRKVAG